MIRGAVVWSLRKSQPEGTTPLTAVTPPAPAHLSTRYLLNRLVRDEVRPHVRRLALAAGCMVVVAATTAAYAYMMEPFDDQWQYVGTKRTATYTNLDPGAYTFRVKGSNNSGV